jgi:hypothetical protein
MFADPQSVTVDGVAKSLPRVGVGPSSSVYSTADGNLRYTISHQNGRRNRRTVRLDFRKIAADPLLDGVSREYSMSAYLVIDHPTVGFNTTEVEKNTKALVDELAEAGLLAKVIGGES